MTSYRKTMREVREEMLQNEAAGDLNDLKKVVAELEKASKMHLAQSKRVQAHVDMMTKNEGFELKEQPEHEIKVGGYTTKFFYMCGSAQKVMSKNADVEGAEELTRMQDDFYKLEKEVMDAGEATDEQKKQARDMYNQIMKKAGEIGLADDIDDYMKMHIDSIEKGDPKLGFGRTDMKEEVELDEAKYDLYHKDFSSAMQHSYKMAKKLYGITVDPKEIDDKVASGPRKPSEGKTNSYRLKGDKGAIQVQVYNKGGSKPFELNMYKEEAELDEGKMKQLHQLMKDGKSAKEIAKIMRLDLKTIKALIGEDIELGEAAGDVEDLLKMIDELENASKMHLGQSKRIRAHLQGMKDDDYAGQEIKTEGAAADARRAMRGDPDMRQRAFSKDDSATDDERKAASKNIMMQMRKAVSLRSFDVEFADGKKVKVPQKMGQAVINKYNSFRRPAEKEKFQAKISKSYRDMLKALKESIDEAGYVKGKDPMPAGKELAKLMKKKRKGKKESTLERMNKKIQENKNG